MDSPPPAAAQSKDDEAADEKIAEILPKSGLVYSEKGSLAEVLCKPKIMPIKSAAVRQMERRLRKQNEEAKANASAR